MYLGMPWIRKRNVEIDKKGDQLRIRAGSELGIGRGAVVRSIPTANRELKCIDHARLISVAA